MRVPFVIAVGFAAVLSGCPLTMSDDYEIVSARDDPKGDGGAGGSATGGNAGSKGGGAVGGTGGTSTEGGAGASTGGAGGQVDASCDPSTCATVCCGALCVDTSADELHCGACNSPCPALRSCVFGSCSSGWLPVATAPTTFVAREKAAYAWTGSQVFIWGGVDDRGAALDSGALYDPLTDQWTRTATDANTPSPRALATAVWTGTEVVVWGGGDATDTIDYADGARYDPATDAWLPMADAPAARRAPIGAWTGNAALFWGGWDKSGVPVSGAEIYDPVTNGWRAPSPENDPGPVLHAAWAWSGTYLYLYGGQPGGLSRFDKAFRLDPATGTWAQLPNGPSNRYGAFGVWDGAAFVVTNGRDGTTPKDGGESFDEAQWVPFNKTGMPTNRFAPHRRSGWTAAVRQGVSLFAGGMAVTSSSFVKNGGLYDRASNQWRAVTAWPSGEDHEWGVGVWTGAELVLWGGRNAGALSALGERYLP